MEIVGQISGWIADNAAQSLFGVAFVAGLTALVDWWRRKIKRRRAQERAVEAAQREMDARIDRHNQLVAFLDQCPPEVQRVLAAFVHAKTHTLTLDPLDSAVAFLAHRGVIQRGPRVDGGGYISLYYFTVEANFWRVMFDERGDNPTDEVDPS